ncbi:relaxase/mobilization nuclease domain-containing protein [Porphyromonas gingivalis]|uniref:relaxase/mobilization nuclease domain-containing protein n=1 Tax=Porphyromonas gingivalis TaxID=837 RepID=UPI0006BB34B7|nr:relaxase/mobilization nuclease domain-containing protein [Porphyromonas gingivalis]PDP66739.1 mobilization protein [Porphyromonas gingivalis]RRG14227.1 mobilization protein [Porphyromonas gingivalis]GAP80976.1 mobilization protein [Porphyromonas gingivalis]
MIAKIMKGSGFKGVINYILDPKKETELIDSSGVRTESINHIVQSFIDQTKLNPRVSKVVGHISLSFSAQDSSKLNNEWMAKVAREYMDKMGIKDTQYIIGRHFDKEHPHVHIAFNRIDNNGKTISDRNDRFRSEKSCKELTAKYGLYFADGKEKVKKYRLKEPDKTKYEIYQALKAEIARCNDWKNLLAHLKKQDINVRFKFKSNSQEVQGIIFEKNGYHFNGSKVDRGFSYSKIDFALQQNNREHEQQTQGMLNLISNVASVTSEITNNLIEGGLDLFQTHGTVPAEVYNTLDKKKKKKKRKIHL